MSEPVKMPTTVSELWDTGWVADNEDEADTQAGRMFDLFAGKEIEVDRLTLRFGDDYDEILFRQPWPRVYLDSYNTDQGWDGESLYPEWHVHPVFDGQIVTDSEGIRCRMGDLADSLYDLGDDLRSTAPGIGTAEGFSHRTIPLIYPPKHGPSE